jgi:hypothetical protein
VLAAAAAVGIVPTVVGAASAVGALGTLRPQVSTAAVGSMGPQTGSPPPSRRWNGSRSRCPGRR